MEWIQNPAESLEIRKVDYNKTLIKQYSDDAENKNMWKQIAAYFRNEYSIPDPKLTDVNEFE